MTPEPTPIARTRPLCTCTEHTLCAVCRAQRARIARLYDTAPRLHHDDTSEDA